MKKNNNKVSFWFYIIPPFILSGLATIFYFPSLNYAFQFDSVANITKHFLIRHNTFKDLFFKNTRWISYWLNSFYYSIGKFDPFYYRLGNLIIHITNGLLVFFILFLGLKYLKKKSFFSDNSFLIAFFTSILFLLHPVQTQTVSYVIQGQLEGLAALSILSMVLCFFILFKSKTFFAKMFLTIFLFVLGFLSCGTKEIAIISPALIALFDWFFIAQGEWSSFKKRIPLLLTLLLFVFGIYVYFLKPSFFTNIIGLQKIAKNNIGNIITQNPSSVITPWMFLRSQFKVVLHYLWIFIWPFNISVEYDWMISKGFLYPDSFFPFLILISIVGLILNFIKKNKTTLIAFGALWFFICLAPRSSIIPSPELLVDYKTYLASLGWLFLLSTGLIWLAKYGLHYIKNGPEILSEKKYGIHAFCLLFAVGIGFLTVERNTVWRSGTEFWSNIIKNAPGKARAYNNYGVELSQNKKDFQGSIPYFKKAISMDRHYADPLNNVSVAYSHLGRIDDAIESMKKSLKINKYYPEGYNNLASFYIRKKELGKAENMLRIALKLRPHYGKAFFNLGRIYLQREEKQKAWECFRDSVTKADFDIKFGFSVFAKVSMDLKKYGDAIFSYKKMLNIEPNDYKTLFNLSNAYFLSKDFVMAKQSYNKLLSQNNKDYKSWYNLAETYFELKEYNKALSSYNKVYHLREQIPYVQVRMAHCYNAIGKKGEAKKVLELFLSEEQKGDEKILVQLKTKAKGILAQLSGGSVEKTV